MVLNTRDLINEAANSIFGRQTGFLMRKYAPYLQAIAEDRRDKGLPVDDMILATTAICCENTGRWMGRMDEATRAINVGSFINHGFELITAVLPNLISNEVFTTQPMTRRVGEVFYMDIRAGTTKGNVSKGDNLFGSLVSGNAEHNYSAQLIEGEIIATGSGGAGPYTGTITTKPFEFGTGTVTLTWTTGGTEKSITDTNGADLATGNAEIAVGTLDANTGAFAITFAGGEEPDASTDITLDYTISFEKHPEHIAEVDVTVTSKPVTVEDRKLRAIYSLDASYDLEQNFGRSLDSELKTTTAMEIRQELDTYNLATVLRQAQSNGLPVTVWDKTPPSTSVSSYEHKWTFIDDALIVASDEIYNETRRVEGNWIVCGNRIAQVIKSLAPRFKAEGQTVPGPHYMGMLDQWRVYRNPHFDPNTALVGHKGNLFLQAGFAFCPYMPIYTTRTAMLDDMKGRFGVATSNGHLMVNDKFYSIIRMVET